MESMWISDRFLGIFSGVAVLSTICLFLTGFEICWRIRKKGSSEGIGSAPFHMGFISGYLWLQYGLLKGDMAVTYVNSVSSILYTFYVFYYYSNTPYTAKKGQFRLILLEIILLSTIYLYISYSGSEHSIILNNLGYCCMTFNIATVGAPLLALRDVMRARSTENLPLPLCLANLIVTCEWLLYGIFVNDFFIKFPNAVAVLMSLAQVFPFMIYPRTRKDSFITDH